MQHPSPVGVLRLLNDAIIRQHADRYCTVVQCRVETGADGGVVVRMCVGGHLPPLLLRPGQRPEPVGSIGTLIGIFPEVVVSEVEVPLGPGDALVLYTDGITEARHPAGEFYGEARLVSYLAGATGSAHEVAEGLAAEVLAFQDGNARDDIAVVVLRRP